MNRKERYSEENMRLSVEKASSIKEALEFMGLRAAGGNYKVFHKYAKEYSLDVSHFDEYKKNRVNILNVRKQITPLSEILVENSSYSRSFLKQRLYKEGLKERCCEMLGCNQGELWMGKKISLILDHINGIYNDNRIENLRIVCPNCNAALPTHAGKNNKSNNIKNKCINCNKEIHNSSKRCRACSNNHKK